MGDKAKVGDTVWYEVGTDRQQAKIIAINGTTHATIRLLTGPQTGQTIDAPWGVIRLDDEGELRNLEERRRKYLSIVNDSRRKKFDRDMAQGDLDDVELKIAALKQKTGSIEKQKGPTF